MWVILTVKEIKCVCVAMGLPGMASRIAGKKEGFAVFPDVGCDVHRSGEGIPNGMG